MLEALGARNSHKNWFPLFCNLTIPDIPATWSGADAPVQLTKHLYTGILLPNLTEFPRATHCLSAGGSTKRIVLKIGPFISVDTSGHYCTTTLHVLTATAPSTTANSRLLPGAGRLPWCLSQVYGAQTAEATRRSIQKARMINSVLAVSILPIFSFFACAHIIDPF